MHGVDHEAQPGRQPAQTADERRSRHVGQLQIDNGQRVGVGAQGRFDQAEGLLPGVGAGAFCAQKRTEQVGCAACYDGMVVNDNQSGLHFS